MENAVIGWIAEAASVSAIKAILIETDANLPCRDLFERCGFERSGGAWIKHATAPSCSVAHVAIANDPPSRQRGRMTLPLADGAC